jgi:hypothetical protein
LPECARVAVNSRVEQKRKRGEVGGGGGGGGVKKGARAHLGMDAALVCGAVRVTAFPRRGLRSHNRIRTMNQESVE